MTGTGGETFASSCTAEETHGSQGCQIMIMIDIEMTFSGITRTDQQLGKNRENENKGGKLPLYFLTCCVLLATITYSRLKFRYLYLYPYT